MVASDTRESLSTPTAGAAHPSAPEAAGSPSPFARAVLVFTRPAEAWSGLRERAQWWFPFVFMPLVTLLGTGLTYHRAYLPMMLETLEERVANGEMSPDQLQAVEQMYSGSTGLLMTVGSVLVVMPVIMLFVGLLVWFTIGFVLGAPFRYRYALEVAAWSSLVTIVSAVITYGIAWYRQTLRGIHLGFAALLPEPEAGDRMLKALAFFLDWIGPFGIWHVAVAVLGAAYLSGAPRKSVAWALGALYLVSGLVGAALAALFPGGQ